MRKDIAAQFAAARARATATPRKSAESASLRPLACADRTAVRQGVHTRTPAPKARSGFRRMPHQFACPRGSIVVDIVVQSAVEAEYLAFLHRIGSRSLERDRMHATLDLFDITQILH